jgi:fatty-acyl-CoA synthase
MGFGQNESSPYITHTRINDTHPGWIYTVGPPVLQTGVDAADGETHGEGGSFGAAVEMAARSEGVVSMFSGSTTLPLINGRCSMGIA